MITATTMEIVEQTCRLVVKPPTQAFVAGSHLYHNKHTPPHTRKSTCSCTDMSTPPLLSRAGNCPYYTGASPHQEETAAAPTYMTGAAASISWQADDTGGARPHSYYPVGAPYPHHHMSTAPPHMVIVPHPSAPYNYYAAPAPTRQEDVLIFPSYNAPGTGPALTENISSVGESSTQTFTGTPVSYLDVRYTHKPVTVVPNPAPSYSPHHYQSATYAAPNGVAGMNVMSAVGTGGGEPLSCAQEASSAGAPSPYLLLVNPPAPLKPGSSQAPPAVLGTTTYSLAPALLHHQANIYSSTSAALPSTILPQPSLCQQHQEQYCPHSVSSSHCAGGGVVTNSTSVALPSTTILPQPSLCQQQEQYRPQSVSPSHCTGGGSVTTSSTGISITTQQDHFCSNSSLHSHDQDFTIKLQAEKIRQLEEEGKYLQLLNEDDQERVPYPSPENEKKKMGKARKKQRKDGPRRPLNGYNFFYKNERLKMKSLLESGPSGGDNEVENPMISDMPAFAFEEEAQEVMENHCGHNEGRSCFEVESKTWLEKCDVSIDCCQDKGKKLKWEEHCKEIFQFLDEKKKMGKKRKRDRKKNTGNSDDKMDATELVKIVSTRWRQLHPYRKEYFRRLGEADSQRYRMEMEEYNAKNNNKK